MKLKKLKTTKVCMDINTYDGIEITEDWMIINDILKIEMTGRPYDPDPEYDTIIITNKTKNKIKLRTEKEFEDFPTEKRFFEQKIKI